MKHLNTLYIACISLIAVAFVVVFDTFPRSTVSQLEKRELAVFPDFTIEKLFDGSFTRDVSSWFSDSEPYRDGFMTLSMKLKDIIRINVGDDNVTFHAADAPMQPIEETPSDTTDVDSTKNMGDLNAKIANAGIMIVGSGPTARALMAFGGSVGGGRGYAETVNLYKETFPEANVYSMVIPLATDFYIPEKVRSRSRPQRPVIEGVYSYLSSNVNGINVYDVLEKHANEDIYLRTDHHWAPLGAYYAAQEFARVAGVPFRDLSSYDRHVVHRFVGSMYGYSKDIAIKEAPEDFVYYTPRDVNYNTSYINYTVDSTYRVRSESRLVKGPYFYKYNDGNGGAYCTFMGGDMKITQVRTSTHNGRRLLILKDSYGNAIPGYLFYSFEEIHVVDDRYFTKNMKTYVRENGITDILFANNTFNIYSVHVNIRRYLTQKGGIEPPQRKDTITALVDSVASPTPVAVPEPTQESTDSVKNEE